MSEDKYVDWAPFNRLNTCTRALAVFHLQPGLKKSDSPIKGECDLVRISASIRTRRWVLVNLCRDLSSSPDPRICILQVM